MSFQVGIGSLVGTVYGTLYPSANMLKVRWNLNPVCFSHFTFVFRVYLHSVIAFIIDSVSKNALLKTGVTSDTLSS